MIESIHAFFRKSGFSLSFLFLALLGSAAARQEQGKPAICVLSRQRLPETLHLGFVRPRLFRVFLSPPLDAAPVPDPNRPKDRIGLLPAPGAGPGIPFILAGSTSEEPGSAKLYLDIDRDGDFIEEPAPFSGFSSSIDGRRIYYFPALDLPEPEPSGKTRAPGGAWEARIDLARKKEQVGTGSLFAREWRTGEADLQGSTWVLHLIDQDSDGLFGGKDLWTLVERRDRNERSDLPPGELSCYALIRNPFTLPEGKGRYTLTLDPRGLRARIDRWKGKEEERELKEEEAVFAPRPPAKDKIPWTSLLNEGFLRAFTEKKIVLLLLSSPGCSLGEAWLEETFRDAEVVELSGAFVPVHILCEPGDKRLARYKLPALPFVLFLDPEENVLERIPGFLRAPEMAVRMKAVLYRQGAR